MKRKKKKIEHNDEKMDIRPKAKLGIMGGSFKGNFFFRSLFPAILTSITSSLVEMLKHLKITFSVL